MVLQSLGSGLLFHLLERQEHEEGPPIVVVAVQDGERIPVALWAAAVGLAQEHGLHRIALELRVDFNGLKKRLERAGGAAQGGQVEARFVELFAAPASTAAGRCECAVELENGRGAKMRVELNGNGLVGLAGVCNAFWSAA